VNAKYRAFFNAASYPQYQPGATFNFLPEHTWAIGTSYIHAQTTVTFNVTGTGQIRLPPGSNGFYYQNLSSGIRLPVHNRLRMDSDGYVDFIGGYALADMTATRRLTASMEGVLQIQNLADHYTNDLDAGFAAIGRQTKIGVRLRF
jgi:hypothetical protein